MNRLKITVSVMYEAKFYEAIFTVSASYTVHVFSALLCVLSNFEFWAQTLFKMHHSGELGCLIFSIF